MPRSQKISNKLSERVAAIPFRIKQSVFRKFSLFSDEARQLHEPKVKWAGDCLAVALRLGCLEQVKEELEIEDDEE